MSLVHLKIKRYIKVDDKPLFMILRTIRFSDVKKLLYKKYGDKLAIERIKWYLFIEDHGWIEIIKKFLI
jgi:hypothetical protein